MNNKLKIYLVDDNKKVLQTLTMVFETAGFEVFPFSEPGQFLQTELDPAHSAILLDLRMPQIGGLEVLKNLKDRGVGIPVIIYSGYADVDATVQAFSDGAFTLIRKPVSKNLLVDKVKHAIGDVQSKQSLKSEKLRAVQKVEALTPREIVIARLLSQGKSAPAIGAELHLSPRTVETHRLNIYSKLNLKSSAELARLITIAELQI